MPPKGQKTAILVVGMYRSGTSAITRILNILGYDVPKNLVQATPDNERGFWESESAVLLNNMIFASTKLTGKHWVAPDSDWFSSPAADEFREQAQALLLDEFGTSRRFVLKNPKLCLLLPLWIDALRGFGAEPLVVLPIRNPLDVAASLMKRDGIDQSTSLLMWLRYVLDSEFASRGLKRAYVRYEDVLEKNDAGTSEIERVLGISLSGDSADTRREINRFLSPELRHHWHEDAELLMNPAVSRWVQMSFEILGRWAHGQYKETDRADLDRIRSAFDEATPAFVDITVEADKNIKRLNTDLGVRDAEIAQITTDLGARDAEIAQITLSNSWKLTRPLREFRRRVTKFRVQPFTPPGPSDLKGAVLRSSLMRRLSSRLFSFVYHHTDLFRQRWVLWLIPGWLSVRLRQRYFEWKLYGQKGLTGREESGRTRQTGVQKEVSPDDSRKLQLFAMRGQLTKGWYGGRELQPEETFLARARPSKHILALAEAAYNEGSELIQAGYLTNFPFDFSHPPYPRHGLCDDLRTILAECRIPNTVEEMSDGGGFSIVTPFYKHLKLFEATAASIGRLAATAAAQNALLEWIIVNDDSAVQAGELMQCIPQSLHPMVRLMRPDGQGGNIVNALNKGIRHCRHRWVLLLDCDDEIESNTIETLGHYQQQFPRCRYMSSSMTDIDVAGKTLRFRGNEHPPERLADIGMMAGHLKAIRRDLFEDIGYFDSRFEICQDYEFALRTAVHEPILCFPEPLYRYRWHNNTLSVSRIWHQLEVHYRIQREYLLRYLPVSNTGVAVRQQQSSGITHPSRLPGGAVIRGAVIIRTRNHKDRRELLQEAVESVRVQAPLLTPIIVVHGSREDVTDVKSLLSCDDATVFLHAETAGHEGKKRGYPANIALDYIVGAGDRFDYVSFLDDDDIFYPCFAASMGEALRLGAADLVYAMTNKRKPWQATEPGPAPLPSRCLAAGNFIPINSFALRTTFLRQSKVCFDEDILYLEDWDFLLSLLAAGARFDFLPVTVSEFRITNDGNTTWKRYPKVHARNVKQVEAKARRVAGADDTGLASFLREMATFNWREIVPHSPEFTLTDMAHEIWLDAERHNNHRA